ncbi:MAG: hypothetical protein H0T97_06625 [Actinobacteria bacterium]|nr:hypothetical protein [Actinomycetota bacterium]
MNALPPEAEKLLLAIAPEEFVAARQRLVRELRAADRSDETATLARLRKPTVVVFAVNRAARDRPKAARSAAEAALHVKETQVGNQPEAFKRALDGSEASLDLLAEVAVAHVAPRGKAPSDAMRRRVRDLLRSAVADDDAREALVRGALTEELEAVGFSPFAGMVPASTQRPRRKSGPSRAEQQEAKRHEHERALREELAEAERHLQETVQSAHRAERERKSGERAVTSIRAKLERID